MQKTDTFGIAAITTQLQGIPAADALQLLADAFPGKIVFSTSFGIEDQCITHMIRSNQIPIKIFTLDTGRLFPETYTLWSQTVEKYRAPIEAWYPDAEQLADFVGKEGPNAFYRSPELRKSCCHIRKVAPLQKALQGQSVWVTGLRAAHSPERQGLTTVEWDAQHHILKFHPLLNWSGEEVRTMVERENIPYNPLHDRGFVSIGCAPCTRAIQPGEDFRAGRWWWEENSKKECGLHVHQHS
ncbi:MAG TPA: phosphoadenylyl-sulfate reductase [Sediminibacterium sp.]|nr:phosphoadenylyl-sulfate reductase [Sediminibacterium sp.]